MPQHRDEQPVGILRIDGDIGDHLAVAQSEVRPGLAGVGRLVHPVARRQVGPDDARPAADVDDVRVRRGDGDRADRARRLLVEERHPRGAVIGGAPDAAIVEADVEDVRLAGDTGQRASAPGPRRADLAPVHVAVDVRRLRRLRGYERRHHERCGREQRNGEGHAERGHAHRDRLLKRTRFGDRGNARIPPTECEAEGPHLNAIARRSGAWTSRVREPAPPVSRSSTPPAPRPGRRPAARRGPALSGSSSLAYPCGSPGQTPIAETRPLRTAPSRGRQSAQGGKGSWHARICFVAAWR